MAINKKLIHFKTKSNFSTEVANNNILDTSICFIKDSQQIYTHGQYYNCKDWANDINGLLNQINTLISGDASTAIDNFNEIIAFLENVTDSESLASIIASIESQIADKQDKINDLSTIRDNASKGATAVQPSQLADVATSGSYNDLTNKPAIPTSATVSDWGFTKNTGTYTKPSTGIPKTDLASAVQTSLGKADTALQSYTETDPVFSASAAAGIKASDITNWNNKTSNTGTVTGVKINGSTKNPSNGVVDLGTVITSHQDISNLATKTEVNDAQTAAQTYADNAVAALVNGAPETLDTLDELAAALKDNKDIVDILDLSISNKQDKGNYVTTDTEQTITAKKIINGTTLRILDADENDLVFHSEGMQLQNSSHLLDSSSYLGIKNGVGGTVHVVTGDVYDNTNWGKLASIGCSQFSTGSLVGTICCVDDVKTVSIGNHTATENDTTLRLLSNTICDNVSFVTNDLFIQNPTNVVSEMNTARFTWDNNNNQLNISRYYYDESTKQGDIKLQVDSTASGGYVATNATTGVKTGLVATSSGVLMALSRRDNTIVPTQKNLQIANFEGGRISITTDSYFDNTHTGGQIDILTSCGSVDNVHGITMSGGKASGDHVTYIGKFCTPVISEWSTATKLGGNAIHLNTKHLVLQDEIYTKEESNAADITWDDTTNTLDITRAYYDNDSLSIGEAKLTINGKEVSTKTPVVNHGTSDTTFAIIPNEYHVWGSVSSLTLTLANPSDATVYNEYMFEFVSPSTATTLSLPSGIKWVAAPDIQPNMVYQVSIVNGLGVIGGFSNE